MAIRGVILDVDGTLVDSNDAHAQAWADALSRTGEDVSFEDVRPLIGMGGDQLLPEASGLETDSPRGRKVVKLRKRIFREDYLPDVEPFPGVKDLLERMRREGMRTVVASSSSEDELEDLLEAAGVSALIDERVSSSDVDASKPEPDVVEAALRKTGLRPGEAVMIGDTPYDVQAAQRAGVAIIALRSGGWEDADLDGAVAIYDAPADLLAKYDDSPLARR